MKDIFSPQNYLEHTAHNRRKQFKKSLLGVCSCLIVITAVTGVTGYTNLLSTGLAEAAQRFDRKPAPYATPQALALPDERENTNQNIILPTQEDDVVIEEESIEEEEYYEEEEDYDYIGENGCNVLGLLVTGDIGTDYGDTTSNSMRDTLEEFASDERVKAILVDVDSGGGSPVGGDEIAKLLEEQTIPVIARIREMGASAAYMAILPADIIFAHRWASVGSIGVILPLYDYTKYNEKQGIKYTPILTSPSKDAGTSDRALTKEERKAFQSEINYLYQGFMQDVAHYRDIPLDKVRSIANGTTMLAYKAKEAGLIDEIGGQTEVFEHLRTTLGEEPVVCWDTNLEY